MTDNNKPEWFEIVDADGPAAAPKASKALPIAAVMVAALILGTGAVVGQAGEESPATATPTASVNSASASPASPVVAATTTRLANPSIAMLPTNGEDEDDEYDDEDEDDEYEDEDDEYEDEDED